MDCSLTGFSVHGIFQARVLEWGAVAFSDGRNNKCFLKSWTVAKISAVPIRISLFNSHKDNPILLPLLIRRVIHSF